MFNGYKKINDKYIYLYLDNNYEFSSDINTRKKKQDDIIDSCNNYLNKHNLNFNDKLFLVSQGIVLGYVTNYTLNRYK